MLREVVEVFRTRLDMVLDRLLSLTVPKQRDGLRDLHGSLPTSPTLRSCDPTIISTLLVAQLGELCTIPRGRH